MKPFVTLLSTSIATFMNELTVFCTPPFYTIIPPAWQAIEISHSSLSVSKHMFFCNEKSVILSFCMGSLNLQSGDNEGLFLGTVHTLLMYNDNQS